MPAASGSSPADGQGADLREGRGLLLSVGLHPRHGDAAVVSWLKNVGFGFLGQYCNMIPAISALYFERNLFKSWTVCF